MIVTAVDSQGEKVRRQRNSQPEAQDAVICVATSYADDDVAVEFAAVEPKAIAVVA